VIGDILQPTHLLFVLVIALLVLGPKRLPEVGRSLGRGLRDFRSAMSGEDHDAPEEILPRSPEQPAAASMATADAAVDLDRQPAPAEQSSQPAEHLG
jgi:sec-independent protein translocase protein TatA